MRVLVISVSLFLSICCNPAVAQSNAVVVTDGAGALPPPPTPQTDAKDVEIVITTRNFRACPPPSRWRTSSHYLRETARCILKHNENDPVEAKRTALIEDIFVKSWSYAILNKGFFWLSVALAVMVLTWPSLVAIFKTPEGENGADPKPDEKKSIVVRAVNAASMQTTITALAALSFAFYAHYKERQAIAENLMRTVLYAPELGDEKVMQILSDISAMDKGFGFSAALGQPSGPPPDGAEASPL